mgnify:CR=1 FL=1
MTFGPDHHQLNRVLSYQSMDVMPIIEERKSYVESVVNEKQQQQQTIIEPDDHQDVVGRKEESNNNFWEQHQKYLNQPKGKQLNDSSRPQKVEATTNTLL